MHFPDIHTEVSVVGEIVNPIPVITPWVETVDTGRVWVHPRKDGHPRRDAGGPRTKRLAERNTFTRQAVHIRRNHMVIVPRPNRIKSLLIGHNQNDVRTVFRNPCSPVVCTPITVPVLSSRRRIEGSRHLTQP